MFDFGGGWSGYKKVAHTGYHRIVNIHINSDSFELRLSPQLLHFFGSFSKMCRTSADIYLMHENNSGNDAEICNI